VSPAITSHDLHQAFGRIGEIRDVYIPRDYHSQQPKGFAFIEYATTAQAAEARDEMDRFVIKGRALDVVFAQEKRKTPGEMRGRVVNQQNRGRERSNFDRSSSFERARQQRNQDGRKEATKQEDPQDKDNRRGG
jgi:RNA recognition motif-containing protein